MTTSFDEEPYYCDYCDRTLPWILSKVDLDRKAGDLVSYMSKDDCISAKEPTKLLCEKCYLLLREVNQNRSNLYRPVIILSAWIDLTHR